LRNDLQAAQLKQKLRSEAKAISPVRIGDYSLSAQSERGAFQELKRHRRFFLGEKLVKRRAAGSHATGKFRAGNAAAFHLLLDLPGHDTAERARFTFLEQVILLQEVVEVRTDARFLHAAIGRE
jgi:hypothetical protein